MFVIVLKLSAGEQGPPLGLQIRINELRNFLEWFDTMALWGDLSSIGNVTAARLYLKCTNTIDQTHCNSYLSAMVSLAVFSPLVHPEQVGLFVSLPALEAERFFLIFSKNLCQSWIPVVTA